MNIINGSIQEIINSGINYLIFSYFQTYAVLAWSVPIALVAVLFGCRLCKTEDPDRIIMIGNKVIYSTIINDQNQPSGFIFGFIFVGYIVNENLIYCICNKKVFSELQVKKVLKSEVSDLNTMNIVTRRGRFGSLRYIKEKLNWKQNVAMTIEQRNVIDDIKKIYDQKGICVSLISGEPGTGKSTTVYLLAKELKASICNTYSPTTPGDSLYTLTSTIESTKENPLVILLDEIDIIMSGVTNETIERHKYFPIEVYNKVTWNRFFDNLERFGTNIIVVLTSNSTYDNLNSEHDKSLLRSGRLNSFYNITESVIGSKFGTIVSNDIENTNQIECFSENKIINNIEKNNKNKNKNRNKNNSNINNNSNNNN
jgi:hypothetical protein